MVHTPELEVLQDQLKSREGFEFCIRAGGPDDFMSQSEYDKLEGPVGFCGSTGLEGACGPESPSGITGATGPEDPSEITEGPVGFSGSLILIGPFDSDDGRWTYMGKITAHIPYTEERMKHYQKFLQELQKEDRMCFHHSTVKQGKICLKPAKTHIERVKTKFYDQIKEYLDKEGEDISKYETIPLDDWEGDELNPLLFSGTKRVVDREAVYSEESVLLDLKIPSYFSKDKLYLTPEKIEWLVEQLSV